MAAIDLVFPVIARPDAVLPVDHAYPLYSSLCRALEPGEHGEGFPAALLPITGDYIGRRQLRVTTRSQLRLLDHVRIPDVLKLAGRQIAIGAQLRLGVPTIRHLEPASRLYSRLVVIKGAMDSEALLAHAQTELEKRDINGLACLIERRHAASMEAANSDPEGQDQPEPADSDSSSDAKATRDPFIRRTVRIHDREIVGYALIVEGLSAANSIRLQERGLGGRRHFGCGVFVKAR